ncbi:MAG: 3-hydroxyacyl-CoA dehydrogenase family protein [Bacteroidales bacterium]|nr:3-hydroxyacyl-CoA dehydrogenase family protein [Bacteroidales bacterium]MCF8456033.1 3-hydroxyacyl-CoA dehydrogenase family protein [Bacteroidales bacterium]
MDYINKLEKVSVLGAAGKMGSGILLLTAVEMADQALKSENKDKSFTLNAIDVSNDALGGLMRYLKVQVQKLAEKKMVALRGMYADRNDLIENGEIIDQYVLDVMTYVRPTTALEAAYNSTLVFEAVSENKDLKNKLLSQIDKNSSNKPWFLTNTSSVPIHELEKGADLKGRIVGFHFYNPPAVQKLVELIVTDATAADLKDFAMTYAKNLRKIIVPSNDFAGFIGNGHFMRDALHGIHTVEKLAKENSFVEAVYMVNKVSQDYLVRPMGIFQLIDYVGVDVVKFIMNVMNPYLKDEDLHSDLLDKYFELGVKGGQFSSGAQKDGFLKYEKGRVSGIYDPDKKDYVAVADIQEACDKKLGDLPKSCVAWKSIIGKKDRSKEFTALFGDLKNMDTLGAKLAMEYGARSNAIGKKLVADNVAHSEADVNTVMLTGFFHAYGPINEYFV